MGEAAVEFVTVLVTDEDIEVAVGVLPGQEQSNPCLQALRRSFGSSWRIAPIKDIVLEEQAPYRAIILPSQAIEGMQTHSRRQPPRPFEFTAQLYSNSSFVKFL